MSFASLPKTNPRQRGCCETTDGPRAEIQSFDYVVFRCAADLPTVTKSGFLDRGEFTVFVEGGAFQTGGGQIPFFGGFAAFTTLFGGAFPAGSIPNVNPGWGWDIAAGADYRFAGTPWH